jgi:WD repeat and SOF domain-containing protein 1
MLIRISTVFAKPFIAQMGKGHVDGVYSMAKDPENLSRFASGSGDGIVKVWDLTSREEVWNGQAHENIVKGMSWTKDQKLLTCATDRTIKMFDPYNTPSGAAPLRTWLGNGAFTSLSHHRSKNSFAAASSVISIYDLERHTAPPEVLKWPTATDTINCVSFKYVYLYVKAEALRLDAFAIPRGVLTIFSYSQIETSVLASAATDRSIVLYDLRTSMELSRTVLNFASNAISWNPMEG